MSTTTQYAVPQTHSGPLQPAGWWARVGATVLDGVAILVLSLAFAFLGVIAGGAEGAAMAFIVAYFCLIVLYAPVMLVAWDGQTLGKRAVDIRVVKLDEGSIGFWRAVLREIVVKGLLAFTALLYWLAALWPLWNGLHRAWWDYASGTRVVQGREVR